MKKFFFINISKKNFFTQSELFALTSYLRKKILSFPLPLFEGRKKLNKKWKYKFKQWGRSGAFCNVFFPLFFESLRSYWSFLELCALIMQSPIEDTSRDLSLVGNEFSSIFRTNIWQPSMALSFIFAFLLLRMILEKRGQIWKAFSPSAKFSRNPSVSITCLHKVQGMTRKTWRVWKTFFYILYVQGWFWCCLGVGVRRGCDVAGVFCNVTHPTCCFAAPTYRGRKKVLILGNSFFFFWLLLFCVFIIITHPRDFYIYLFFVWTLDANLGPFHSIERILKRMY